MGPFLYLGLGGVLFKYADDLASAGLLLGRTFNFLPGGKDITYRLKRAFNFTRVHLRKERSGMAKLQELPKEVRQLLFFMVENRYSLSLADADAMVYGAAEATGLSFPETKKVLLELYQIVFDRYLKEIKNA